MNARILNRDGKLPEDGWFAFEPNGEHVNHASRVVLVIDEKARESIANRFAAEATAAGDDFSGQRIDKDHLSQSLENTTESMGWAMQVRNRGLLEAKIDWTALGQPLVESRDGRPPVYKFFSTEYDPDRPGDTEKIGTRIINRKTYTVLRPLRLDGLSLTNDPNNKGQRPIQISNRKPGASPESDHPENEQPMKALLKKMGLDENASEDAALAAYEKINNRATTAEATVATVTAERDTLLEAQIERDLDAHKAVIKNRDSWKARLKADRKGTLEILADLNPEGARDKTPITNRKGATPPDGAADPDAAATAAAEQRAAKISNRARQLRDSDKTLGLNQAYDLATAEVDAAKA